MAGGNGGTLGEKAECLGKGTWQIFLNESCLFWEKSLPQKISWKKVKVMILEAGGVKSDKVRIKVLFGTLKWLL